MKPKKPTRVVVKDYKESSLIGHYGVVEGVDVEGNAIVTGFINFPGRVILVPFENIEPA